MMARFAFYATRAEALAHAPADRVFTVIDRSRPSVPHPSVEDLIRQAYPLLQQRRDHARMEG
jgi:hypothetical protein